MFGVGRAALNSRRREVSERPGAPSISFLENGREGDIVEISPAMLQKVKGRLGKGGELRVRIEVPG